MATVNERLAALEAAVSSLTGLTGGVSTTVLSETTATHEAQQNQRLTVVETKASTVTANLVTETTQRQGGLAKSRPGPPAIAPGGDHRVVLGQMMAGEATLESVSAFRPERFWNW